jgi:hypothetical protein
MWTLWCYSQAGRKRSGPAVVITAVALLAVVPVAPGIVVVAVAVVVAVGAAASTDAAGLDGLVRVADLVVSAAAAAAVARCLQ